MKILQRWRALLHLGPSALHIMPIEKSHDIDTRADVRLVHEL